MIFILFCLTSLTSSSHHRRYFGGMKKEKERRKGGKSSVAWQRVTKGMQKSPKQCQMHKFVQAGLVLLSNVQIVRFNTSVILFICFAYIFEKITFSWAEAYILWHLYKGQPKAAVISVLSWLEFWCYNLHNGQGKRAGGRERKGQGLSICVKEDSRSIQKHSPNKK